MYECLCNVDAGHVSTWVYLGYVFMTDKNNKRRKPNNTNTGSDSSAHSQSDSVTQIGLDKADIQKLISEAINEAQCISEKLDYALEHLT